MYEFPNENKNLTHKEIENILKRWNLKAIKMENIGVHHHIFSHIEWDMIGYKIQVEGKNQEFLWKKKQEIINRYPMPGAFMPFRKKI